MSKAFTKENDSAESEEFDREPKTTGPGYISSAGFKKLQEEFDHLWRIERPKVTNEVAAAAAMGDRSENAEYIYGKRRLREIDRRLRFLKKRLDSLVVVERNQVASDTVVFGAKVTVEDENGEHLSYTLVGPDEIDLPRRCISIHSPVGKALLGKRVDDHITVRRPKGDAEFRVVKIEY